MFWGNKCSTVYAGPFEGRSKFVFCILMKAGAA